MAIKYRYRLGKKQVLSPNEELVEEYKELLMSGIGDMRFGAKYRTTRVNKILGRCFIAKGSSFFAFSVITDFGIHYVCAVIVSLNNQIVFVCKSTLNKEFKQLHSAGSVKRCINKLKTKGSIKR